MKKQEKETVNGSLALKSPRVVVIQANTLKQTRKLRVAAYARVSSNSEDQLNSFAAQNAHYTELITSNPDWEFVDVYADKGITGTSAEKRDDFQRLLADCRRGRIDKILVKSSSRFARNAKECLEAVRELKALDVSVYFEEQNIDTGELSGELLVAIFAMMDQKESETISQNIRWGVDVRMRAGKYNTCHAPFGYRLKNGKLELLPESLPIIQYIFHAYLSGDTASGIASALTRFTEDLTWNPQKVDYILTNERYCGNALLRKRFATDTLPRKKQRNHGERSMYFVERINEAAISPELFERAKALRLSRNKGILPGVAGQRPLANGLTQCGCCGRVLRPKCSNRKWYMVCRGHEENPSRCNIPPVPEDTILTALEHLYHIHCLMIGASGVGKTAFFLYPNLEYACASGMSFFASDTKGDLARNYGTIAEKYYGYQVSVIDLRNPSRSDGYNLLTVINHWMDQARKDPKDLGARARAEKYAKLLAKTIVNPDGDSANRGQNAYFYEAAEGVLAAVVLLLSEFLPPTPQDPIDGRHIVSVFKLVQDLMEPSAVKGKTQFHLLMSKLPEDHMARWLSDSALKTSEQAMASVMSTLFSRLNSFLDSDLEQIICFDSSIDAKTFAQEKCAIFLVLPEEDPTKNFMAGLMIQNLSRELFTLADTYGGKLPNRVVFFCDELGTMPPFDILPLFSAGRSRRLTLVPIIQSLAQLEKNYGKEGSEIIQDNTQDTIFGGFAPGSQTAEVLSKSLGSRTVQTGYVNQSKNDPSQSLQMAGKPLMTPDELKALPKGEFVVMKTGRHPMRTRLRLFLEWGITFEEPYIVPPREDAQVRYAGRRELMNSIMQRYEFAQSRSGAMPLDSEKGERNKNTAGMKT